MTPEETLQKAIEIAYKNGYKEKFRETVTKICIWSLPVSWFSVFKLSEQIPTVEDVIFSKSFREALVGKGFVYPKAVDFSSTMYLKTWLDYRWWVMDTQIEMSMVDYHLMMIAKSEDRLQYLSDFIDWLWK